MTQFRISSDPQRGQFAEGEAKGLRPFGLAGGSDFFRTEGSES